MTPRSRVRMLVAAVAISAGACSGPAATISNEPTPAGRPAAAIPLPQSEGTSAPAPSLPPRGGQMPPNTVPLMELYRQGTADVLR